MSDYDEDENDYYNQQGGIAPKLLMAKKKVMYKANKLKEKGESFAKQKFEDFKNRGNAGQQSPPPPQAINISMKSMMTQRVINLIILVILVILIIIVVLILYKLYHSYPRIILLGRTAPLDEYMKHNIKLVVNYLHMIQHYYQSGGKGGGKLRTLVDNLFKEEDIVPSNNLDEYLPESAPYLYFNFMFKRALSGDLTYWKMSELNLIKRISGLDSLVINGKEVDIYNVSGTGVTDSVAKHIKKKVGLITLLEQYFGENDCEYLGQSYDSNKRKCDKSYKWCNQKDKYPNALIDNNVELARQHLSLIMFRYTRDIETMYDFRKSGGLGNFIIYNIFMSEYIQFIFKEKIPDVWDNFLDRVKATGSLYWDTVTSPAVSNYMAKIPVLLAGVDEYTEINEMQKKRLQEQEQEQDEDVVEHFMGGFGNLLKSLAQLLPNLLKIILAFVQVVTNPLKIVRFIIGLVLGIVIYLVYLVIAMIGPLFYIPAFLVVLSMSMLGTILWTALFVALALIYFILWILDWATNGFVFSLMRCENLPSAWHEGPNYVFGNFFKRTFMCSYPCSKKYIPNGWFCKKMNKRQPSYCPQQIIMNNYVHHVNKTGGEHSSLSDKPLFFDYKIDAEYIMGKEDEKRVMLGNFHDDQRNFTKTCNENLAKNQFIVAHICNNLETISATIDIPQEQKEIMKTACHKCFCKYYYLKDGCRMTQRPYIRILKSTVDLKSKFVYKLTGEKRKDLEKNIRKDIKRAGDKKLEKGLRNALQNLKTQEGENIYVVNDGFENDEELRRKQLSKLVFNIPNSTLRYNFCSSIIDDIEPDLVVNRRKKGAILLYVLYALLMLIMVSFGIILLYAHVKGTKGQED